MQKVVISGGPSTGKSTIFEALRSVYPDAYFVEEAAEIVIQTELDKKIIDTNYEPIMPVSDYRNFAPLVINQQISLEKNIPSDAKLVFMDRGIIDNLGYLAYNKIDEHTSLVHQHAESAAYTIAFFCEWLNKFEQTSIRRESPEQGLAIHKHLEDAYQSVDIPLIYLPPVSVEERLSIIDKKLSRL